MFRTSQTLLFLGFWPCQVLAWWEGGRQHMQILPHCCSVFLFAAFVNKLHYLRLCHRRKSQGWVTGQILSATLIILWNMCECNCEYSQPEGRCILLFPEGFPSSTHGMWVERRPCLDKCLVGEILGLIKDTREAWPGCADTLLLPLAEAKVLSIQGLLQVLASKVLLCQGHFQPLPPPAMRCSWVLSGWVNFTSGRNW